jgi:hypothetical protein
MWRPSFEPVLRILGITRPYFEPMSWFWTYIAAFTACGEPVLNQCQEYWEYQDLVLNICWNVLGILRPSFEPALEPLRTSRPCFEPMLKLFNPAETQYWTYVGTSLASLNLFLSLLQHSLVYQDLVVKLCWDFLGISRLSFEPMLRPLWNVNTQLWIYGETYLVCWESVLKL